MENNSGDIYEFAEFTLKASELNLWRDDKLVPLSPKVFETLLMLVANAGEILEKEQMIAKIWPSSFVEESNLSQNIYVLRQLFGKDRKFIETVPRRGYRFIEPVQRKKPLAVSAQKKLENEDRGLQFAWRKWSVVAGVFSLAVVVIGMAAFYISRQSEPVKPFDEITMKSLSDSGSAFSPAISPDGRFVAYLDRSQTQSLRLMDVAAGKDVEIKIESDAVPGMLTFSPDGNELYFRTRGRSRSGQRVFRMSYFGGAPVLVANDVWGSFNLSPKGDEMAFFRLDPGNNKESLIVRNISTGSERSVHDIQAPEMFFMQVPPSWSPDSRKVTYLRRQPSGERTSLEVIDVENGTMSSVATGGAKLFHVEWHPDGKSFIAVSKEADKGRQIWRIGYPDGSTRRITNDLNNYTGLSVSTDGLRIVSTKQDFASNVWVYPAGDASAGRELTSGAYGHFSLGDLRFATEDRIVFDARNEVHRDLWITGVNGSEKRRLTENMGSRNTEAVTTSDGRFIYISSNRTGSDSIWRLAQDGSTAQRITDVNGESHWFPTLSHDEQSVFYLARISGRSEIRRIDLATGETQTIFIPKEFAPSHFLQASPDGKYLAFGYKGNEEDLAVAEDGAVVTMKIGFIDLTQPDGFITHDLRTNKALIRFTNGGKTFDYIRGDRIIRRSMEKPDEEETVFALSKGSLYNFDWSLSGTQLAVAQGGTLSDVVHISLPD